MKTLILFVLLLFPVISFSQYKEVIDEVRTIELVGDTFMITFWGNNRVFNITERNRVIPCLEDAYKAHKKVVLLMDQEAGLIHNCKLFAGELPPQ